MPHWMYLKNPTRWVSEGCPLSTEWEVIERGFGGCAEREGGFEGCPRAVSLRLKPPLPPKLTEKATIALNFEERYSHLRSIVKIVES